MKKLIVVLTVLSLVIVGYFSLSKKDTQEVNDSPPTVLEGGILEQANLQKCEGKPTPNQPAGPYYKTNSPNRNKITEPVNPENTLTVEGFVYDQNCIPIVGAMVDFWQAGEDGEYDNLGYNLRGHQFTNEKGEYSLETVIPAMYSTRPPHIHVKIQTSMVREVFTSQLYFVDKSENVLDTIFDKELIVNIKDTPNGKVGNFNFIVLTD